MAFDDKNSKWSQEIPFMHLGRMQVFRFLLKPNNRKLSQLPSPQFATTLSICIPCPISYSTKHAVTEIDVKSYENVKRLINGNVAISTKNLCSTGYTCYSISGQEYA